MEAGLRLLIALCDALEFARVAKIVHRDVKPTNIFITPSGSPKLVDFGVAKITDAPGFQTAPQVVVGTALYVSPEQIRAQPATHRSDLYALGLVAYQIFSGEHPLLLAAPEADRRDLRVIWALHLHADPPRLDQVIPAFPEYVARLVHTAMSKEPAKRYASAAEFGKRARETLARYENDRLLAQRVAARAGAVVEGAVVERAVLNGAIPAEVKDARASAGPAQAVIVPGTPTPEWAVSDGTLKRSIATPSTDQFVPPTPSEPTGDPPFPSPPLRAETPGGVLPPMPVCWPSLLEASVWTPSSPAGADAVRASRRVNGRSARTLSRSGLATLLGLGGLLCGSVLLYYWTSSKHPGAASLRQEAPVVSLPKATEVAPTAPPRLDPKPEAQPRERKPALPRPVAAVPAQAARPVQKPPLRVAIGPLPVQKEQSRDQGIHWADSIAPPEAPTAPAHEEEARKDEQRREPWLN